MKKTFHLFLKSAPWMIPTVFLYLALDQAISTKIESEMLSTNTSEFSVWFFAALSMLVSLVLPLLSLIILVAAEQNKPVGMLIKEHFASCLKESMRAWGKVILWSILLILPGLIQMIRMAFVPFVVLLSEPYKQGQLDALKESQRLSKPLFLRLLGTFLLFSVLIPLFLTAFDDYKIFWKTPVAATALGLLEALLMVAFYQVLLGLFQRSLKNVGTDLQLETNS